MTKMAALMRRAFGGPVRAAIGSLGGGAAAIVLAANGDAGTAVLFGVLAGWCAFCWWVLVRFGD